MIAARADYTGRVVLVTGGTRGIGLATAREFAARGAQTVLTHAWGSADEARVTEEVVRAGGPAPLIVQADVTRDEDTIELLSTVRDRLGRVDVLIANASVAQVTQSVDDYSSRGFLKSMRGGAWPAFDYLTQIKRICGEYPRYVVIMSSDGPDRYTPGYDMVAAGKAAAEAMTKYVAYRLREEGVRINVLRSRAVRTEAFDGTFGREFYQFLRQFVDDEWFMTPEEVGQAAFALCSGLFDGMTGETIMADRGATFYDSICHLFAHREELGL